MKSKQNTLTHKKNENQKFENKWLPKALRISVCLLILSGCSSNQSVNLTPVPAEVKRPVPKEAFMCRMPEFNSEYFDDLPAYILDTQTMLSDINRKNRNVNSYNRSLNSI